MRFNLLTQRMQSRLRQLLIQLRRFHFLAHQPLARRDTVADRQNRRIEDEICKQVVLEFGQPRMEECSRVVIRRPGVEPLLESCVPRAREAAYTQAGRNMNQPEETRIPS